nr:hypothetical protein [Mycobacterium tuberculosis]
MTARLLTRAIPALAVAGLGMDRYFRGGGFDNLRRRITGFRWAAARHLLGDILGDRSGSGMIENHGRWQRQSPAKLPASSLAPFRRSPSPG